MTGLVERDQAVGERRGLIMRPYAAAAAALVLVAPSLPWMIVGSLLVGLFTAVMHVALPITPELVAHVRRRTVFLAAAVMNLAFMPLLWRGRGWRRGSGCGMGRP